MRRCAAECLAAAWVIGVSCQAQSPVPPINTQSASPVFTLRSGTNLVIEDVVVTDANHNPVHNLKAADFTVSEDGRVQHIRSFREFTPSSAASAKPVAMPKLTPGIFSNFSPAPREGPANILLLDTLNTPLRDQSFVRSQLLDYLKKTPDTQVAIFGLSNRLSILQGFTSDPAILRSALLKKNVTKSSSLLDDANGGGGGGVSPSALSDTLAAQGSSNDANLQQTIANVQQFEAETGSYQLQLRARYTLDALNELARYLAGIPGRKNLIWFSGSFPLNVMPNGDLQNSFAAMVGFEAEFRETATLLARSQVAVYPIDARGLTTSPVYGAANAGTTYGQSPVAAGKDEMKFAQQTGQENQTMLQLADDTGGRAFVNTNGLSEAVSKAVEAGSSYYTLTYSPTNTEPDGKLRRISIETQNKGLVLSYRRGYYGSGGADVAKTPGVEPVATAQRSSTATERVMMRGAPASTQILFTVRVLPVSQAAGAKLADGNSLTVEGEKLKGAFRPYTIDLVADQRSLVFVQSPDGVHHDIIEFLIAVYDRDGTLINRTGSSIHADLSAANFAHFLETPLTFNQDVSVPDKGEYFLRIAVHDLNGDRFGSVEVPVSAIKDLAPLGTPPVRSTVSSQHQ